MGDDMQIMELAELDSEVLLVSGGDSAHIDPNGSPKP